ncbi:MAG: phosphate ABC transporter substrate-binding protein PstS [Brevinemataceae bacterium]
MKKLSIICNLFILCFTISSCGSNSQFLQGAGATFPAPLYNKLFALYSQQTGTQVTYQAIGSGAGIQNIESGIVDFGASDAFLTDNEIKKYQESNVNLLHIPAALASVNFAYNIPGLDMDSEPLALDAQIIFDIYSGKITKWNDPKIAKLNPNTTLPNLTIIPVYRSDSSGTTFTMTEFMSKANTQWASIFGIGKTMNWTIGVGQKGNSSVIAFTKENEGAISYVDLVYAVQNNVPVAKIKNKAGSFVIGGVYNTEQAVATLSIPNDARISITYTSSPEAAPMATFSYLLVREEQNYNNRSLAQAQELVKMLIWLYSDEAQAQHSPLYFTPMPQNVIQLSKDIISQIKYDGIPVISTL